MRGDPPGRLRVLSLNLRGCLSLDGPNLWPRRRAEVARLLAEHPADILGFQEALRPNLRFLRRTLSGTRHHRGAASGRTLPVYNPLFWGPHLTLEQRGSFWLSPTPHRRSAAWGAHTPRVATWIRLRGPTGPLLVVNLHLDHLSPAARLEGAALVRRRMHGLGWPQVPALVLGDFNANPGQAVHRAWLEAGLRDTWQSAGHPDDAAAFTFHGFTGQRHPAETRIDWILHTPQFAVHAAHILDDARPPRYPSDHYAMFAELTLEASAGMTP